MSSPAEAAAPPANPSFSPPATAVGRHARSASDSFVRTLRKRPEFFALLAFAGLLYVWGISVSGYANDYYAAAARSMGSDWHDFLYNSFDPSGVQTVDKPPLALWVQALSVRIFGFHSLSLLLPQALMGVGTVALSYNIVFKRFGRMAAAFAGFGLAVTPILVAVSRHNNPDALLTLLSVGAVWALLRAIDDGRMRWVVVAGALVGLAFETKMAAGLLILPAMVAAYMWVAPGGYVAAIKKALAGGAALLATGLAWPVLVWLTPASSRPWISGTNDNSIWSLITGYNGVGRVEGQAGGPGGNAAGGGFGGFGGGGGGGGMGGSVFGNDPGIFRLFGPGLGGQAAWLLIFALVAGLALVVATRLRRDDKRTPFVIAVGGSLLTILVAFSFAKGIFHPYYVVQFAPFAAMLFGAGFAVLRKSGMVYRLLAGAAMLLAAYATLKITSNEDAAFGPVPLIVVVAAITATGALFIPNITARERGWAVGAFMALLLVAPSVWALQTPGHALSSTFPAGGPQSTQMGPGGGGGGRGAMPGGAGGPPGGANSQFGRGFGPPAGAGAGGGAPGAGGGFGGTPGGAGGGMFGGGQTTTQAVRYAAAHGGGTVGVAGQTSASSAIIASGAKVAGLGGFSGRESSVSVSWLAGAVGDGRIRWVMTEGGQMVDQSGRAGSTAALAAAAKACTKVTGSGAPSGLYDCQGKASALRALSSS